MFEQSEFSKKMNLSSMSRSRNMVSTSKKSSDLASSAFQKTRSKKFDGSEDTYCIESALQRIMSSIQQ